jgi:superfamily II DNA helicase RecQ
MWFALKRDLPSLVDVLAEKEDAPNTIIFCRTKNDCSKVYSFVSKSICRHTVSMYHGSLSEATKSQVLADFTSDTELRCLSATITFGMVNIYRVCT